MSAINFKYGRAESMSRVLSILEQQRSGGIKIVEVGVARGDGQEISNGHSSILFAWYMQYPNKGNYFNQYIGIDISSKAIEYTQKHLKELKLSHPLRVSLVCMDAIKYFKEGHHEQAINSPIIDLLYLDGWDYEAGNNVQNKISEEATLECLKAAEPFFDDRTMVLFDDVFNDIWHGKAKLAIPYLMDKGWIPAYERLDNQVLMIQNCLAKCES